MYFPWIGQLEQIRAANVFVSYDDVQFTRGFFNRVQVKVPTGTAWMTVPIRDFHRGQTIDMVRVDDRQDWRTRHLDLLRRSYREAPFAREMLALVE
jgi:WbqC-like protein family